MPFSRHVTLVAAFLIAALLPGVSARAAEDEAALYEAAKKEGEVTWYTAQFSAEVAEAVGKRFRELWPGVKTNIARTTAQVAFQKLSQDMKAGVSVCDVLGSTDTSHYVFLKQKGALLQWTPPNADKILPVFQNADPDGYFHNTSLGLVLIAYNTEKVKAEDAPKNWKDLLDPKWKDRVATGHPGFSGFVGTWAVQMHKLYGKDFFVALEKNRPQVGRSITDTVTMLNSGERSVAFGTSNTTSVAIARGNPLALIYPTDGTVLMISPSAILKDSKRPNAAKLFLNYLMSADAAKIAASYQHETVRPDVAPAKGATPLDQVKLIRPTDEEIEQELPKIKELWRDIFGN